MWDLLDFLPIPVTQKKPRNTVDIGFFFKSVLHSHLPTIHVVFSATAFLTDKVVREGDACWPVGQSMPSKSLHIVHVLLERGSIQLGGELMCLKKCTSLVCIRLHLIADLKAKQSGERMVHWSNPQMSTSKQGFKCSVL